MGLDMYLYAKPSGSNSLDVTLPEEEISKVLESNPEWWKDSDSLLQPGARQVGYWRKANHIHAWFVEHVQGGEDECNPFLVHPEVLADLYQRCQAVMADPSKGPELLPTQSGFFFGGTEYDEYYLGDVKDTLEQLDKIMADPTLRGMDLIYRSSW